jgi:hypothetical protein
MYRDAYDRGQARRVEAAVGRIERDWTPLGPGVCLKGVCRCGASELKHIWQKWVPCVIDRYLDLKHGREECLVCVLNFRNLNIDIIAYFERSGYQDLTQDVQHIVVTLAMSPCILEYPEHICDSMDTDAHSKTRLQHDIRMETWI